MSGQSVVSRRSAAKQAIEKNAIQVNVPCVGVIHLPAPQHLAFYAGLGILAALGVIEWGVAAVLAIGHFLAREDHNRLIRDFGEALAAA
jgi:hypothetical protein